MDEIPNEYILRAVEISGSRPSVILELRRRLMRPAQRAAYHSLQTERLKKRRYGRSIMLAVDDVLRRLRKSRLRSLELLLRRAQSSFRQWRSPFLCSPFCLPHWD